MELPLWLIDPAFAGMLSIDPSAALRQGAIESDISAAFGGENVVQFGPSSALPHGASGPTPLAKEQAVLDAWLSKR
jgi:hypothetical protein